MRLLGPELGRLTYTISAHHTTLIFPRPMNEYDFKKRLLYILMMSHIGRQTRGLAILVIGKLP